MKHSGAEAPRPSTPDPTAPDAPTFLLRWWLRYERHPRERPLPRAQDLIDAQRDLSHHVAIPDFARGEILQRHNGQWVVVWTLRATLTATPS